MEPLLEMKEISKSFPGVQALSQVDFSVFTGEVLALVGENGAGKSTLMKILGGAYQADSGDIFLKGKKVKILSPVDGIRFGLNVVYQELVLAPHLSVAENILLGQLPRKNKIFVDWGEVQKRAKAILDQLGVQIKVSDIVRNLSVAQQQIIEIARALQRKSQILVLDEPSAVLGKQDIDLLYSVINRLKKQGVSIIYISHRLDEVFKIADRITVLKDGKLVATKSTSELTEDSLVKMMIGRELKNVYQKQSNPFGKEIIKVEKLCQQGVYNNISFSVHEGEIFGIAGLVGSGRTDLVRAIAGAEKPESGKLFVYGKLVQFKSPANALKYGLSLLPEDRNSQSLFLKRPIIENISIASLKKYLKLSIINLKEERKSINELAKKIGIRTTNINQIVADLSGGNKQKVVLARWLGADSKVLIFDEPTRGVDVGAKMEIYSLMNQLASEGVAIIMVSSEMPEILGMSDNIMVMWRGEIACTMSKAVATNEKILQYALLGANKNG